MNPQHQPPSPSTAHLPTLLRPNAPLPAWNEFAAKWARLPEGTAPTPTDRQAVSSYCRQVAAALTSSPAESPGKLTAIQKLYAVLAVEGGQSDDLMDVRNLVYLEALSEYPEWAVSKAVKWWIAGEHPGKDERREFVPKPAQLIRLVKIAMEPVRWRLDRALRMQRAIERADREPPEPTPEERERMSRQLEALAASLRLKAMSEATVGAAPDATPNQ
jgi:hypothetical protein